MLTYTRDAREPIVEKGELIHQVYQGWYLSLRVVSQNLFGGHLRRDSGIRDQLLVDKAEHGGLQLAIGNLSIVGGKLAVKLEGVTGDGVVRVVRDRVIVLQTGAPLRAVGYADVLRQAVVAIVGRVIQARALHTAENVVKGPILEQDPDDVLDIVLQVRNRLRRAGLVTKGRINTGLLAGRSQRTRDRDEAGENGRVDLHCDKIRVLTKVVVSECPDEHTQDLDLGRHASEVLILRAGMRGIARVMAQGSLIHGPIPRISSYNNSDARAA